MPAALVCCSAVRAGPVAWRFKVSSRMSSTRVCSSGGVIGFSLPVTSGKVSATCLCRVSGVSLVWSAIFHLRKQRFQLGGGNGQNLGANLHAAVKDAIRADNQKIGIEAIIAG